MRTFDQRTGAVLAILLFTTATFAEKPYRLPDLGEKFHDRVIWGSEATSPDGFSLAFGGQNQVSDDGIGHTRMREKDGEWVAIDAELRKSNPNKEIFEAVVTLQNGVSELLPNLRHAYFEGVPDNGEVDEKLIRRAVTTLERLEKQSDSLFVAFQLRRARANEKDALQGRRAPDNDKERDKIREQEILRAQGRTGISEAKAALERGQITGTVLQSLSSAEVHLSNLAALLAGEPPPRAMSPIVYEPKTHTFVLFGGEHFDYLTNDVWVFDIRTRQWSFRYLEPAPPPRANHTLRATGDGKIEMKGGYTYTSNTDYCGGQYVDLDDGQFVYDVEKDMWSSNGKGASVSGSTFRTYRKGPFHPNYFIDPPPDRGFTKGRHLTMRTNEWVKLNPPKLPRLNRDWGTAVLDPDRDLILRYSGGHSAHGGTDVLHYHIATNRWELCYPVEFPLGQLYANTRYPNGFNFNGRPWITGHTYQNYGYDVRLKKMLFSGREDYTYIYDIDRGDWDGRIKKPAGMVYNSCFYTLTNCSTPQGLVCWTKDGKLFRFDADKQQWLPLRTDGEELPGAVVDNSTVTYDSGRKRLLFFRKLYGNGHQYDGQIHAYDLKTGEVTMLSPEGMPAATAISYLCQIRYDEANDLLLVGATLPPDENGLRRTPAYDPAKNRWVSLKITGDDPSGAKGRNVSLGMMYDASRQMFLAVDTNSQVYAMKLDVAKADVQPLPSE